jgi:alpha/beta superfamily hydrolase
VASRARSEPRIERVALVALPVRAYDCSLLVEVPQPGALFMAGRDEFGTLADLERLFPALDPRLERYEVPEADHFFDGRAEELQELVRSWAERALER